MKKVKLARAWNHRRPGAVVVVDEARAALLVRQRLGEYQADKTAATRRRRGALTPTLKT